MVLECQSSTKVRIKFLICNNNKGPIDPDLVRYTEILRRSTTEHRNFQLVSRATCWWRRKPQREEANSNLNAVLTQKIEISAFMICLDGDFDNQLFLREVFITV